MQGHSGVTGSVVGAAAAPHLPRVVELLRGDAHARDGAARALAALDRHAAPCLPQLEALLGDATHAILIP